MYYINIYVLSVFIINIIKNTSTTKFTKFDKNE